MAAEVAGRVTGASMPDGGGWSASIASLTRVGKRGELAGAGAVVLVGAAVVVVVGAGEVVVVVEVAVVAGAAVVEVVEVDAVVTECFVAVVVAGCDEVVACAGASAE